MSRLDRPHWQLMNALAQDGSLSAAAESLNITQSAASQRLKEAERRIGGHLVHRQGKSLWLTDAGVGIASMAERLEKELVAAEADAIWLGHRKGRRLRLVQNYHDTVGLTLKLTDLLQEGVEPIDLELVRCRADGVLNSLKRDLADFAILPEHLTARDVEVLPLYDDHLVAMVGRMDPLSKRETLSPQDFHGRRYLTYGLFPQEGWEYHNFFRGGDAFPRDIVKLESTQLILQSIAAGRGVSILPKSLVFGQEHLDIQTIEIDCPKIEFTWNLHLSHAGQYDWDRKNILTDMIDKLQISIKN